MTDLSKQGWGVTVVEATNTVYQHYFRQGEEKSMCGRSDRGRLAPERVRVSLEISEKPVSEFRLCAVCRRKMEVARRKAEQVGIPPLGNGDEKMGIIEAVALINSFLGEDFITSNAMYNRIWRIANAGADPACAPEYARLGKRSYFMRSKVMEWVREQVRQSEGLDFSQLPADLAAQL